MEGEKRKKNAPRLQRHRRLVARHRRVQLVQLEVGVPNRVVHLGQVRGRAVPAGASPLQTLQSTGVELLPQEDDAELERVLGARGLGADALSEDLGGLLELAPDQDLWFDWSVGRLVGGVRGGAAWREGGGGERREGGGVRGNEEGFSSRFFFASKFEKDL